MPRFSFSPALQPRSCLAYLCAPLLVQVSAHGTGAAIPPVDEQVVALKLVTPALGTLELSQVGLELGPGLSFWGRRGRTATERGMSSSTWPQHASGSSQCNSAMSSSLGLL